MRSLTLTGAAILTAALLTGCGAESGPTAENVPGLAADAADHNVADHFKVVVTGIFDVEARATAS
jgi:predicted outer membrane protein